MTDLIRQLQQATDGLLFPSETDAPVYVFVWRDRAPFSPQALLQHRGYHSTTPIQETSIERFFRSVTTPRDWHGPEEQERVQRFTALRDLLQTELSDVTVYKIGTGAIDVYVVGRDGSGNYLGITTHVVET
jgi:hypothetical protein